MDELRIQGYAPMVLIKPNSLAFKHLLCIDGENNA